MLWCYLTSLSWWREDQKRSWRTVHHQDSGIWVEIKHCRGKNQRWALTMFSLESFFNSQQRHLKLWNLSEMHLGFQLANEQGQVGVWWGNSHTSFLRWTYILWLSLVILWWTCLLVCTGLEEQLDQAKKHVEQFRSMSEANESALGDLNKVS